MISGLVVSALALAAYSRAQADTVFEPAPAVGDMVATFQEPYCDTAAEVKAIATAGNESFDAMAKKYQELAAAKNDIGTAQCAIAPHDTVKVLSIEPTGIATASDGKKYQTYAIKMFSPAAKVSYFMLLFRGEKEAASEPSKS